MARPMYFCYPIKIVQYTPWCWSVLTGLLPAHGRLPISVSTSFYSEHELGGEYPAGNHTPTVNLGVIPRFTVGSSSYFQDCVMNGDFKGALIARCIVVVL